MKKNVVANLPNLPFWMILKGEQMPSSGDGKFLILSKYDEIDFSNRNKYN